MGIKYARKRDENEREIISALKAAGAAVAQLDGSGIPDLLVSFKGTLYLLEVKLPDAQKRNNLGSHDELTPTQAKWWQSWYKANGVMPEIVHTVEEALAVIRG